jgi:hypothetical protein
MNQRNGAARWPKGPKRGSRISDNDLFQADEIADEEQVENEKAQKSEVEGSAFERDGQPHGAKDYPKDRDMSHKSEDDLRRAHGSDFEVVDTGPVSTSGL